MGKTFRFGGFGTKGNGRKTKKESDLRAYDAKPHRNELIDSMANIRRFDDDQQITRNFEIDHMIDGNTVNNEDGDW